MKVRWLEALLVGCLLGFTTHLANAQEVVHALTGTVTALDPSAGTITVKTNDDSGGTFVYQRKMNASLDKTVRQGTIEPSQFKTTGDHVIVYYYGDGIRRNVVALRDLGKSPLNVSSGTVTARDRHAFTIKTPDGKTQTYELSRDATVDTPEGVVNGWHFDADKGSTLTVRYTVSGGNRTAEFVSALD